MNTDTLRGSLDYLTKPWLRNAAELHSWAWRGTGPMNGQPHRCQTTLDLMTKMNCQAIVETGTYRGTTTEFLARTGLPVHTIETDPRLFAYSRLRLRRLSNVRIHHGSSPDVIDRLGRINNGPAPSLVSGQHMLSTQRVFFYLDAHWDAHIPLAQELAVIRQHFTHAVVMVDDFAVPGDSYRWLDRGPDARLDESSLRNWPDKRRWYPQTEAWKESGQNTGWVVLAQDDQAAEALDAVAGLRRGYHVYQSTASYPRGVGVAGGGGGRPVVGSEYGID